MLRRPEGLLDELAGALALARQRTLRVEGFKAAGRDLGTVSMLVEQGTALVAAGDPCGGAAAMGKAARLLDTTRTRTSAQVARMRKAIFERPPRNAFGDADEKELELAGLDVREGLVRNAVQTVAPLRRAYTSLCRGLGPKVELVGRIATTRDSEGRLQLEDGRIVALAGARYGAGDIWLGGRVRVVARRLGDGSWLAESVTSLAAAQSALVVKPCVALQIVPVQDFQQTQLIRHAPRGYALNGVLRLEAGMRVGASPKCAAASGGRYSLMIVMSGGGKAYTVAPDLDAHDVPVSLPVGGSDTLWSIRVYERYQASNCAPPSSSATRTAASATKSFPCPPQLRTTTRYDARIHPTGSYGRASYDRTIFPLESSAPQIAKVQAIYPLHFTIQAAQATLEGEGYKPGGSPGPRTTIKLNEPFALWPDEYYGAPLLFPLMTIGIDHFAGLLWPRIVGTRNGKPFRYVATLPRLVKDLLPDCPSGVNCFYRLPWKVGTGVTTSQGNGPGFSHNGKQLYAFDFAMSDGATIYATRGGVVGDLVESNSKNFNPCADNNNNGLAGDPEDQKADGPSNYVRIDHGDGLYSYYAHVRKGSVVPAKGDVVERGDAIASVGNTGRSCGAHLHYQVASDKTNTIYGQTTVICFEGWLLVLPLDLDLLHCYKPVAGDLMLSNNG
jgi:murein DD-endopeptidase MepM/ murein hydrolase activator NlpD